MAIRKHKTSTGSYDEVSSTMNETIENLLDKHGLRKFLDALVEVCGEKADHVIETWGDEDLADEWKATGRQIEKIGRRSVIR